METALRTLDNSQKRGNDVKKEEGRGGVVTGKKLETMTDEARDSQFELMIQKLDSMERGLMVKVDAVNASVQKLELKVDRDLKECFDRTRSLEIKVAVMGTKLLTISAGIAAGISILSAILVKWLVMTQSP